jgi:transcriptional regulator MraZ
VARRFRGESIHKVDAKGRVSIPAAFRRVLEEGDPEWTDGLFPNLILVYGGKSRNFIEGYTVNSMDEVDDRIAKLPRGSKQRRLLEHMFSGQSVQVQVDPTGRLVLSQKLRDKIGIKNEAFFIASGDTFQIWEPSAYDAHAATMDTWFDDQDEDADPLILLDTAFAGE